MSVQATDLGSRPATTPRLITVYCLQLRQVKHPCVVRLQGRNQLAMQGSSYGYMFSSPYNSFFYRLVDKYKILSYCFHIKVLFYIVVLVFT